MASAIPWLPSPDLAPTPHPQRAPAPRGGRGWSSAPRAARTPWAEGRPRASEILRTNLGWRTRCDLQTIRRTQKCGGDSHVGEQNLERTALLHQKGGQIRFCPIQKGGVHLSWGIWHRRFRVLQKMRDNPAESEGTLPKGNQPTF